MCSILVALGRADQIVAATPESPIDSENLYNPKKWVVLETLHEGFLRHGVLIDYVEPKGLPIIGPFRLAVTTPTREFILTDLSQLHGAVQISTKAQALAFVRLRMETWDCWSKAAFEIEKTNKKIGDRILIAGDHAYAFAPGIPNPPGFRPRPPVRIRDFPSGVYGILSEGAYKIGGFHPPVITKRRGRYLIVRDICDLTHNNPQVEEWQEEVGSDGNYHITVTKIRPAPLLPETVWQEAPLGEAMLNSPSHSADSNFGAVARHSGARPYQQMEPTTEMSSCPNLQARCLRRRGNYHM